MDSLFNSDQIKDQLDIVSIYLYEKDPSVFIVGKVEKFYSDAILLRVITMAGDFDGFILININSIYQIEYNTTYLLNIEKRIQDKKLEPCNVQILKNFIIDDFLRIKIAREELLFFVYN